MEERKKKEIEHSAKRRSILQGFERISDTYGSDTVSKIQSLIKDKKKFDYHFSNMKYYSITISSENYKEQWIKDNIKKKDRVLDFACGSGENGILAAKNGAKVDFIDISPEGIENTKNNLKDLDLNQDCNCVVMDGEAMTFDNNTFDFGIEYGALHHVDLDKALFELARVIKPNGKMLCIEALRHNPFIHLYRKLTPHLRTEWEVNHILGVESLETMKKYFSHVEVKYFHLASLFLVPLRKYKIFTKLYKFFDKFDHWLLSKKIIQKYAWIMIIELKNPKK